MTPRAKKLIDRFSVAHATFFGIAFVALLIWAFDRSMSLEFLPVACALYGLYLLLHSPSHRDYLSWSYVWQTIRKVDVLVAGSDTKVTLKAGTIVVPLPSDGNILTAKVVSLPDRPTVVIQYADLRDFTPYINREGISSLL